VAFTIPTSFWLQGTLAIFMIIAFASATHDISADGFYIIGLKDKEQELYVGLRNTFYRIGMIIGQGGLVMLAGWLQNDVFEGDSSVQMSWSAIFLILGGLMGLLGLYHTIVLPNVEKTTHESFNFHIQLKEFVEEAHSYGLLTALAGSVKKDQLKPLHDIGCDVVGIRGAACVGGDRNTGKIHHTAVAELKELLDSF
jgi:MFS family permease